MAIPEQPKTREELYLAKIGGQDVAIPEQPKTRVEMYLDYIANHSGSGSAYNTKPAVATVDDLPTTGNEAGDLRVVEETGQSYAWDGEKWVLLSMEAVATTDETQAIIDEYS